MTPHCCSNNIDSLSVGMPLDEVVFRVEPELQNHFSGCIPIPESGERRTHSLANENGKTDWPAAKGRTFFIGAGVPKAGTSWLHRELNGHPEIWMPPHKELHFFDLPHIENRDFYARVQRDSLAQAVSKVSGWSDTARANEHVDWYKDYAFPKREMDLEWYKSLFRPQAQHRAFGEITPAYVLAPKSEFERIRDAFPNIKIFLIFRDPADRIISNLKFRIGKGQNQLERALQDKDYFLSITTQSDYRKFSQYDDIVRTIDSVFPKDQVFYMFYENLFKGDTEALMAELYSFLGVDPKHELRARGSANKSPSVSFSFDARACLAPHFSGVVDFMNKRFGQVPENWLK